MPGVPLLLHAVERRPDRGATASRARTRSCPARPAASSAWCAPRRPPATSKVIGFDMGGTSTDVVALRRRVRARLRHAGGRRAHARADDEHPHHRGRRRLDPAASTARACASAPSRAGANPGPACYRRGGPLTVTDANVMLGKHPAGILPARVRPAAPTSRSTATVVRAALRGAGRRRAARTGARDVTPEAARRGLPADRGGEHGQRDQAHLGGARLRRHAATRCSASAAPAASTPAWSPTRWA